MELERYTQLTAMSLYEKFLLNSGEIEITDEAIYSGREFSDRCLSYH